MIKPPTNEREVLARTIFGESRGEPLRGQRAVASVIMNRANNGRWWGRNIRDVCLKPWQFSCWSIDDANRRALLAVTLSNAAYRQALKIADEAIAGTLVDETFNADHFHTVTVQPLWSRGKKPTVTIGNHRFFRLELREPVKGPSLAKSKPLKRDISIPRQVAEIIDAEDD